MNTTDEQTVLDIIDSEGFEYAFTDYSDFKHIKDEKFHKLRLAYVAAHKALAEYVGLEE